MFGTKNENTKEAKSNAWDYEIRVLAARATKNNKIVMIDLDVNGVQIKSCMLKEAEVKADGEKHKKGDIVYFVNFPSEKVGDKYYNRVWFPLSNDNLNDIINQVKSLLG